LEGSVAKKKTTEQNSQLILAEVQLRFDALRRHAQIAPVSVVNKDGDGQQYQGDPMKGFRPGERHFHVFATVSD
jgi:hypothetical protein